jgi:hypothetical protein
MWFFKKKLKSSERRELTAQELAETEKKWQVFHDSLPKEFTLSSRCRCVDGNGQRLHQDFHFVMDARIPGLYRAKFDWRT